MNIRFSREAFGLVRLYIATFLMSFGPGMILPAIPIIAASFKISVGLAAQLITALALGRAVAQIPGGLIVDRWGSKYALILSTILAATGALVAATTPLFSLLLLALFLMGTANSVWMLGREVAGVDLVRHDQRGRMMSGFFGFSSAGEAIGPVVGGILADRMGFRVVFTVYLFIAVAVLLTSLTISEKRKEHKELGPLTFRLDKFWEIDKAYRTTYLVLVFTTFTMMLYRTTLHSMLPLFVVTQLGFSTTQVGTLFGITGICVLVMIVPAGFITDKVGRKFATVPSTALPAIAFVAYPFSDSMLQLSILSALIGMSNGLSLGSVATSTYDVIPEKSRGQLQGLRRTIGDIGGIIGPLHGGVIANAFKPGMTFLIYFPLLLLAASLLAFASRETLGKANSR